MLVNINQLLYGEAFAGWAMAWRSGFVREAEIINMHYQKAERRIMARRKLIKAENKREKLAGQLLMTGSHVGMRNFCMKCAALARQHMTGNGVSASGVAGVAKILAKSCNNNNIKICRNVFRIMKRPAAHREQA